MREKEIELYEKLLCTIAENKKAFKEGELTAFAGSRGIKYNGNLLIVGRAVNGWTNKWMPSQADNPLKRQSIVQDAFKLNESKCPMIWVSELWGNRNPKLKKLQHDIARQIFFEELCQWKPKRIIFFTGRDWVEPFVETLVTISDEVKPVGLAQWVGKIHTHQDDVESQFVVLPHPQGKPGQLMLSSIMDSFKNLQEETSE